MIDPGRPRITFQWINPCPNDRLRVAQQMLLESIHALGLEPSPFPAGPEMVKFGDILRHARRESVGTSFVWCHSDVLLTKDPFILSDRGKVLGFHRRETPSGEICPGVDMYLIPNLIWDNYLSRDIPDLWCGGTHVDWWLTRTPGAVKNQKKEVDKHGNNGPAMWIFAVCPALAFAGGGLRVGLASALATLIATAIPILLLAGEFSWSWSRPEPRLPEFRTMEIKAVTNQHGVELWVNPEGFQTYDAPLPSSWTTRPFLALLNPEKGLAGGFKFAKPLVSSADQAAAPP